MKKVIAWLLVLALTAAVSIGATLAYLTNTDEDVNVMTLGNVKIDQLEYERVDDETANDKAEVQEFHDNKPLYPAVTENGFDYTPGNTVVDWTQIGKDGYTSEIWDPEKINNELDKMVFVKNKGSYNAYVRTIFAFEAGNYETLDQFQKMMHLNLNDTDFIWEWIKDPVEIPNEEGTTTKYFVAVATYKDILAPGALTEISLSQIALDKTATNADVEAFGETYQILVKTQAIQADGFENAVMALDDGFGIVDEVNIPWETDSPTRGIDLKTALHNVEGDTAQPITTKVSSVTFGLQKDYPAVVNNDAGTLVDAEQDVPVYAYYVSNGGNYDVYFLSSDVIYAPANSTGLFRGMTALTTLNAENLDMSRVETMRQMFRECSKLANVDFSGWDTSKVTDIAQMFYKCDSLTELDLSTWDVSSLKDAANAFRQCAKLKNLDLSGWNAPELTSLATLCYTNSSLETINLTGINAPAVADFSYAFCNCTSLKQIIGAGDLDLDGASNVAYMFYGSKALTTIEGTENWNVSSVTNTDSMFRDCSGLTELDLSTWVLNNVTYCRSMFSNCSSLTELDATNFGLAKSTDLGYMFAYCYELETLKSENWTIDSAQIMHCMFMQCYKLKNVDTQNWNTVSVTDFQSAFRACKALETLDVSNWDVSNVVYFNSMFSGEGSNAADMNLKELDVSNWNPVSVYSLGHMFYGCAQMTSIDMSGWNMPNLHTTSHMFADCHNLVDVNFDGWYAPNWYSMDAMFNDCRKLKTVDVSSFTTSNVVEFSQIFEACWALEEIIGIENWDTAKGKSFDQTFLTCSSLKTLDLSNFDTRNATAGNKHLNGDISKGFDGTFGNVTSLEKLILGENFVFDGNGSVSVKATMPNPAAKEGYTAKWRNVETGELYAASEIPSGVAATYEAYYEPISTN